MSDAELKKFEDRLIEERDKLRRGFTVTITVYIVVALAITVYSIIVFKGFKDLAGPKGLSEQCMSYINLASQAPEKLQRAYDKSKEDWSELVVKKALDAIPEVETLIKAQLDGYNGDIRKAISREIMPNFKEYMKGSMPTLKGKLEELKKTRPDATIGMVLTNEFVVYLDKETARLSNEEEVLEKASTLQRDLYALQAADKPMTRKQLATRQLLISFILISKMDPEGSPILEELKRFLEDRFGVTAKQLQEDKVLEDIETDDKHDEL